MVEKLFVGKIAPEANSEEKRVLNFEQFTEKEIEGKRSAKTKEMRYAVSRRIGRMNVFLNKFRKREAEGAVYI